MPIDAVNTLAKTSLISSLAPSAVRAPATANTFFASISPLFIPALIAQQADVQPPRAATVPEWLKQSNENTGIFIDAVGKYNPEATSPWGIKKFDPEILDIKLDYLQRKTSDFKAVVAQLRERLSKETDRRIRQDLEILILEADIAVDEMATKARYEVPFWDVGKIIHDSLANLLDERMPPERRKAALVRLRRYVGLEEGYFPLADLATTHTLNKMKDAQLLRPFQREVQNAINATDQYIQGIRDLFGKFPMEDADEAIQKLAEQLSDYQDVLRTLVLPGAREKGGMPDELYRVYLRKFGIDYTPDELIEKGKTYFAEFKGQMNALVPAICAEKGWLDEGKPRYSNYQDVIRELKKDQIGAEEILALYKQGNIALEKIIDDNGIVSRPKRPMNIRQATPAESNSAPVPHYSNPALLNNQGESGVFILPLSLPGKGGQATPFDDFTHRSAILPLLMHEGRPGHDLQCVAMVESGISDARAVSNLDGANIEGWAMYIESDTLPFLPTKAEQLISLQMRLFRSARMFMDPMMQRGQLAREEGYRILTEECLFSPEIANSDLDRYLFRMPGQATGYMTGYGRLWEIRRQTEETLAKAGIAFDKKAFHDFIIEQGIVPLSLLAKAVAEGFVPQQLGVLKKTP